MKNFEPSPDFVNRVMVAVRAETRETEPVPSPSIWLTSTPLRWALICGGAAMTLINLARMLASVFAPALCR